MATFTLEALQAEHGDCLLLHYDAGDQLHSVVIDGGPEDGAVLAERLGRLREARIGHAPLPLELVVVSHIHDDHIGGLLAFIRSLDGGDLDPVAIDCLWHNSFADLVDEPDEQLLTTALARLAGIERYAPASARFAAEQNWQIDGERLMAEASVGQGQELRDHAERLEIELNCGFTDVVMAPPSGGARYEVDGGLILTVVWPDEERIGRLRRLWRRERVAIVAGAEAEALARIAAYDDSSIENLASIVFLAEYGGRSMLLTGDARGDHILDGLRRADVLTDEPLELDVLKLQHHGSVRNFEDDFFAAIRARHYVISANGRYGNPEAETLRLLVDSRDDDDFTIWLTNRSWPETDLEERLGAFRADYPDRDFDMCYRDDADLSLVVNLEDPLTK